MEDGDYIIRVGNSSRNTHVAGKISVAEDTITEQYSNLMVPVKDNPNVADDEKYPTLEPMTTEGATPITYDGEADEIAAKHPRSQLISQVTKHRKSSKKTKMSMYTYRIQRRQNI